MTFQQPKQLAPHDRVGLSVLGNPASVISAATEHRDCGDATGSIVQSDHGFTLERSLTRSVASCRFARARSRSASDRSSRSRCVLSAR